MTLMILLKTVNFYLLNNIASLSGIHCDTELVMPSLTLALDPVWGQNFDNSVLLYN